MPGSRRQPAPGPAADQADREIVRLDNVSFSYNGTPALTDVNLTINAGDFACVVGPNGGGKTTLVKLMIGLLTPTRGSVRLFGQPPGRSRHRAGYVPQQLECDVTFPVRVRDVVLMGRLREGFFPRYSREDKAAALQALEAVELYPLRNRTFGELSGGERQRVLIARALAGRPEILVLDEPTAHVDIAVQKDLHDLLTDLNRSITIVLITHDLGFVSSYVNQVICVNRTVVKHPTSRITGEIIAEMYGTDVSMVRHDHDYSGEDRR